jgi:hypothetical protein
MQEQSRLMAAGVTAFLVAALAMLLGMIGWALIMMRLR